MYIHNITFMHDPADETAFIDWLRGSAVPLLSGDGVGAMRLAQVAEVPGAPDRAGEALSVALQAEFGDIDTARRWAGSRLPAVADSYRRRFGHDALLFATILRSIDI